MPQESHRGGAEGLRVGCRGLADPLQAPCKHAAHGSCTGFAITSSAKVGRFGLGPPWIAPAAGKSALRAASPYLISFLIINATSAVRLSRYVPVPVAIRSRDIAWLRNLSLCDIAPLGKVTFFLGIGIIKFWKPLFATDGSRKDRQRFCRAGDGKAPRPCLRCR